MSSLIIIILLILIVIALYLKYPNNTEHFADYESLTAPSNPNYFIPKIIWTFWDSPDPPKIVKLIIENRTKVLKDYQSHTLSEETLHKFISLEDIPANYSKLMPQHKGDWIRLKLLSLYGGIWLDASIIVNNLNDFTSLYDESVSKQSEYTGFYVDLGKNSKGLPSYIDNWFIMAPIDSNLIKMWLLEYESAIDMGFEEYLKKIQDQKNIEWTMPETYFTAQLCLQVLLQDKLKPFPNILIHDALHHMMKIHANCSSKFTETPEQEKCIGDTILDDPTVKDIPYIKLRSNDRKFDIEPYFEKNKTEEIQPNKTEENQPNKPEEVQPNNDILGSYPLTF
jgi:hypothetical protein